MVLLVEMKGELQPSRNNSKCPAVYGSLAAFLKRPQKSRRYKVWSQDLY